MKQETLLKHFEELAERIGIKVFRGKGDFQGGSCLVKNENVVVLNTVKPVEQRLRVLARGVVMHSDFSDRYIVPAVREYIEETKLSLFSEGIEHHKQD